MASVAPDAALPIFCQYQEFGIHAADVNSSDAYPDDLELAEFLPERRTRNPESGGR